MTTYILLLYDTLMYIHQYTDIYYIYMHAHIQKYIQHAHIYMCVYVFTYVTIPSNLELMRMFVYTILI